MGRIIWLTGVSLLAVVYYFNANMYLVDSSVRELSSGATSVFSVAIGVGGWVVYDLLCKSPPAKKPVVFTAIGFMLMMTAAAYGLIVVSCGSSRLIRGNDGNDDGSQRLFCHHSESTYTVVDGMIAGGTRHITWGCRRITLISQ